MTTMVECWRCKRNLGVPSREAANHIMYNQIPCRECYFELEAIADAEPSEDDD